MAELSKEVVIDKIEVLEGGSVQVRTATRIFEGENLLSQTYHRHVLQPGDDLTEQHPKVVAIAQAAWAS